MPQYNPALSYTGLNDILNMNEIRRSLGQTGLTPSELQSYAQQAIREMYIPYVSSKMEQERLAEQKRQFDIRTETERDIAKQQAQASRLGALTSLAGTAGLGALMYKGMPKTASQAVSPTTATAPAVSAPFTGTVVTDLEAIASMSPYEAGVAGAGEAGSSISSTLGAIPGWGWAGIISGTTTAITTGDVKKGAATGGGATAGAYIGSSILPPVGTIVGGLMGSIIGSEASDTVICTELCRQGIISSSLYTTVHKITDTLPLSVKLGYYSWAIPLVKLMMKSKIITKLVSSLAIPTMHYISSTIDLSYRPNIIGKVIWKVGKKLCDIKGKSLLSKLCEVYHA